MIRKGDKMKLTEQTITHIIIGSGAAGFQAALRLYQNGERDLAIITENIKSGTSRNTGSDKQTYYKLTLSGNDADSVRNMAEDLFAGQCVDGDQALCEAALSARCFFALTELGVPFPCTEHGEFMGYKTDHDRGRRATSAGPYTSKLMTEALERSVKEKQILILDQMQAIQILTYMNQVKGILCLDKNIHSEPAYKIIWCKNVILATGGPAGMYHDSVYPVSQTGSTGMAFEAGASGKNLTEWQFGMASLNPRWNVSGTYMQVLPSFISTDQDGNDEKEFLLDYFNELPDLLSMVFLKGYQWPFDVNKIFGGSSVIDLLVYQETVLKKRRVFLDYRVNPGNLEKDRDLPYASMIPEAKEYLSQAGACFGTPIERLKHMNEPAILFYQDHHVDLFKERLEIAVCAQHNNGGLSTNHLWETNLSGLYAIGEVCASHGVTRPGGTALNAGQVGAVRAAEGIFLKKRTHMKEASPSTESGIKERLRIQALDRIRLSEHAEGNCPLSELWINASKRMSAAAGMIRNQVQMETALKETEDDICQFMQKAKSPSVSQLSLFYKLYDMLLSQKMYLFAMLDYAKAGGGSRGSALYTDSTGELPGFPGCQTFGELYRCRLDQKMHGQEVQEVTLKEGTPSASRRPVRPLPDVDYFFENQWRIYRERMGMMD
ncbi:FAD-binding protein [Clostridium sp. AM22-11AC]|jgi:succinate dehydrogenase/fumarate reductase flavoprotein subunit|nr:FAD-binding protein [Clostridium sp. AM22-11AC]RHU35534.1 FAD-binding protein [Clostridium sp. TM06-18]